MYNGKEPYIFISYCHDDSETVLLLIDGLEKRGFRVWYDEGTELGSEWPKYIAEKLFNCSVVIAFLTKNFDESRNCNDEINFSIDKGKTIVSVHLEKFELSLGLDLRLCSTHKMYRNNFADDKSFLDKIADAEILKPCRYEENETENRIVYGKKTFPDGSEYEGELVNGKCNGKGKITYANGDVKEGEWKDDKLIDIDFEMPKTLVGKFLARRYINK